MTSDTPPAQLLRLIVFIRRVKNTRKPIKAAEVCSKCGAILKPEVETSFCDYSKQEIPKDPTGNRIEITVFWKDNSDAQSQEFCSLKCARTWLIEFSWNIERVSFMTLPYLHTMKDIKEFIG